VLHRNDVSDAVELKMVMGGGRTELAVQAELPHGVAFNGATQL
jgi:hypothetical protein